MKKSVTNLTIHEGWAYSTKTSNKFKIQPKDLPEVDRWAYARQLARKQVSKEAQLKLEWVIYFYTDGRQDATSTAHHFTISRKTLHKWLKRFKEKDLAGLEELARKPYQTRRWEVTFEEEQIIRKVRKANMELGKEKLKTIIQKQFALTISTWKIGRVINRYKLFPQPKKSKVLKKKQPNRLRINTLRDEIKEKHTQFGYLWHIDTVIIHWNHRATASKKVDSLNGKEEKFESSFSRKDTRNWLSAPPLIA